MPQSASDLTLTIEYVVRNTVKTEISNCFSQLREEVFKELGISEYITLSRAYITYSENFIKKWRRGGKLKNAGTPKRVKFRIEDVEKAARNDACYQEYLQKKYRIAERKRKKVIV